MKKGILITSFLLTSLFGATAHASELKKSCVKDNPIVAGETDPTLLGIFAQVCDKKNSSNKNAYLVQAAQQFQKIGRNLKALQLVNQLNTQGFNHSSLTDVKFLASVAIANQAVNQIRNQEVRYLNEESYAAVTKLTDAVKNARPLSVIDVKEEPPVRQYTPKPKPVKPKTVKPKTVKPKPTEPKPESNPSGGRVNPFTFGNSK
ncbi:hypothetical protein G9F32_14165 [Acinetobacter sp. 194]|uniref:hypothetical protein n=1 Tax=Acinetobacter shaoyimingii TaxID=2715164 RepID=UPI0014099C05|nr:hypothetical protein [Acinetobacter shaoyimingii]NHB59150.1 hypothetical protein [Acinetobacter shaoyimingii]